MGKRWHHVVFNLIVEADKEERSYWTKFYSASGLYLEAPILVVIGYDWTPCMAYNENGCEEGAYKSPKKSVKSKRYLPGKPCENWKGDPKSKMHKDENCV